MKVKVMPVGPIGTNCYIVEDDRARKAAIIDPGDDPEAILAAVAQDDPEMQVDCILLTHGHHDHTGAIPALRETLPEVPVYIHRADFGPDKAAGLFNLPADLPLVRFYDDGDTVMVGEIPVEVMHPGTLRRLGDPEGGRRPLHRGHPVCRLLRPHRLPRREL